MPHPFQSLVNSWVKVNAKHATYFPKNEDSGDRPAENTVLQTGEGTPHLRKSVPRRKGEEHVSDGTAKTSFSTSPAVDPETLAIQRMDSRRQNRRRLRRTVSHSDLLREIAKEKSKAAANGPHVGEDDSSPEQIDSSPVVAQGISDEKKPGANQQQRSLLRPSQQYVAKPHATKTTGRYLNEAVFVAQMEQARAHHQRAASLGTGTASADGRRSALHSDGSFDIGALNAERRDGVRSMIEDNAIYASSSSKVSGGEQGPFSDPGLARTRDPDLQAHSHDAHATSPSANDRKLECVTCEELEQRLKATLLELEYLRSASVRAEYSCKLCEEKKASRIRPNPMRNQNQTSRAPDVSKRLVEVAQSHRRQIEQMTKERSRWRTDMQVKLSKITMICKELNEENGVRKQAAASLESELQLVREERNMLASEVEQLRVQVALYEREEIEFQQMQETTTGYERGALDKADDGIGRRDDVTVELLARLERTIEALEHERKQLRQRRQIIFPSQRQASGQHETCNEKAPPSDMVEMMEELKRARDSARVAEQLLEDTRAEADRRETSLREKCQSLEKQLKASHHAAGSLDRLDKFS